MTQATPVGSPRQRFRSRLAARPLLVDGGLGTLLFSRGVPQRACLEELVATHPEMVGAAHREYLEAGAELIETLSFGANRQRLAAWGLEGQVGAFNRRAAQLAREAREVSGRDALVGGSVGPLGSPDSRWAGHRRRRRAGDVPRADRGPARGRGGPDRARDVLGSGAARPRRRRGAPRVGRPGHRLADVRRGTPAGRRQQPGGRRRHARSRGRGRGRGQLRGRTGGLSRRARGDGRSRRWRPREVDHAQRRAPAATRGALHLRRERGVLRDRHATPAGGRSPDRRWLLRDDARAHRRDAGRPGRDRGAGVRQRDAAARRAAQRPPTPPVVDRARPRRPPATPRPRPAWPSCSTPAISSSRSRSIRRGASGSSGRSRPPGSCATPASTSSTSPIRRWPGSG